MKLAINSNYTRTAEIGLSPLTSIEMVEIFERERKKLIPARGKDTSCIVYRSIIVNETNDHNRGREMVDVSSPAGRKTRGISQ